MTVVIDKNDIEEANLQEASQSIRRMGGRKRLRNKEWKDFFLQDDIMEVAGQERFLRELGDIFTTKSVNDELYLILADHLDRTAYYLRSRNIDLTNSVGSNPLSYAKSKIKRANEEYHANQNKQKYITTDLLLQSLRHICRALLRL